LVNKANRNNKENQYFKKFWFGKSETGSFFLDNLPVQISYLDPEMRIIWNNAEAMKSHNLEPGSIAGQKCHQAYHGLNNPCPGCPILKTLETGTACSEIHKDSNDTYWHLSGSPIQDEQENLTGVIYISSNITELKKAEDVLVRNSILIRNIIDHSTRLIFAKDLEGRFILASKSMAELYGFNSDEDMLGLVNSDFLPSSVADQLRADDLRVINNKETIQIEEIIPTDKGDLTFLTVKFPLLDGDGRVYAVCGVSADITKRVSLEQELKKSRELLDKAERINKVGGWEYDVKGDVVTWTAGTYRLHGLEPSKNAAEASALINKSTSCYKPEDRPLVMQLFKNCIENGIPYDHEFSFTNFEGREMWVRTTAEAETADGRIVRVIGNIADITELRQARENLLYLSFHDPLTNLYNRRFLEAEIVRHDTARQLPLAIIVCDLNNLKLINDHYGHKKGDEMLTSTAAVIKKCCREEDIVARWGGDEFVILLPQNSHRKAERVCRRINQLCANTFIAGIPVSIALGLAVKTDSDQKIYDLFMEAEKEMYRAKQQSKQ
jgi:diguanylate cyclase (GGDEF)-like protein/PAS domain S-box-containing protein